MVTIVNNFSNTTGALGATEATAVTISWKDEIDNTVKVVERAQNMQIDFASPKIIKIKKIASIEWPKDTAGKPYIPINCSVNDLLIINAIECKPDSRLSCCRYSNLIDRKCNLNDQELSDPLISHRCLVCEDNTSHWTIKPENIDSFCLNIIAKSQSFWTIIFLILVWLGIAAGVWAVVFGGLLMRIFGLIPIILGTAKLVWDKSRADSSAGATVTIGEPIPSGDRH